MKRVRILWLLLPLLAGVSTYFVQRSGVSRYWFQKLELIPILECPDHIDLGERELGEVALAHITIRNRGGKTLIIDSIQSNCACAGLEQMRNGEPVRISSLRVNPNDEVDVVMRLLVQGSPGVTFRNGVQFRTNDPMRPTVAIEGIVSKVRSGIVAVPSAIAFGTVSAGNNPREIISVYDLSEAPRKIRRISSTNPNRASVELLGVGGEESRAQTTHRPG
jgi:hypothetical protein